MRIAVTWMSLVIGLVVASRPCHAVDADPIDLSAFDADSASDPAAHPDEFRILPVREEPDAVGLRPYVSGIVGGSFATLNTGGVNSLGGQTLRAIGSINETMLTGGGALGVAAARPAGRLRMEIEGRARGPMSGQTALAVGPGGFGAELPLDVKVTNGWSTLTNFWRDVSFSDSLGVYAGGGFGVGGYQYAAKAAPKLPLPVVASSDVTTFAWQVGTGFLYDVNDRITIDTGYRFFAMTPDSTPLLFSNAVPFTFGQYSNTFSASEFLVSIRIYEPFRSWR